VYHNHVGEKYLQAAHKAENPHAQRSRNLHDPPATIIGNSGFIQMQPEAPSMQPADIEADSSLGHGELLYSHIPYLFLPSGQCCRRYFFIFKAALRQPGPSIPYLRS